MTLTKNITFLLSALALCILSSCSFKGISIPAEVKTYFVNEFKINRSATLATADLGELFSEQLKEKIRQESNLVFSDTDPDVEFSGQIKSYRVESVAPKKDEEISFSRLTIAIEVEYQNHRIEKDKWKSTFSYYQDFSQDQSLFDVQDQLINAIFKQLTDDVFNKAFTTW